MSLAILCSGQGWQRRGMFALTGDAPEASGLFAHASRLFGGRDPREMVRSETHDDLHHNRVGQILCALQPLAAAAMFRNVLPNRMIVAGYSIGEVAAWGVAGLLEMTDTLDLVAKRAEAMDAASSPGDGLYFMRGIAPGEIARLCLQYHVEVAIDEPGDAVVLGGSRMALQALGVEARSMGATRIVELPVEVASHTSRLAKASAEFRVILGDASVASTRFSGTRLLSGVDGSPVLDIEAGLNKLAAQISKTVQWETCLESCIEAGATLFLELGPGRALSDMVAGAYGGMPTRSLDDFRTREGVRDWLAANVAR